MLLLLFVLAVAAFLVVRGTEVDPPPAPQIAAATTAPGIEQPSVSGGTAEAPDREGPGFADPPTGAEPGGARQVPTPERAVEAESVHGERSSGAASSPELNGSSIVWVRNDEEVEVLDAPNGDLVAEQGDETEFGSLSVFSVQQETRRWIGVSTPLVANGELGWIRADRQKLRAGYVDTAILVDLSERSAELYQGGELERSWTVTVGAAPTTTPTGTFAVTDTFRGGLNPAYGCCAAALTATQPNLPSDWSGGNRIAIHGTGGPLGVAASIGCVRSDDRDVLAVLETVSLGTPVTIRA